MRASAFDSMSGSAEVNVSSSRSTHVSTAPSSVVRLLITGRSANVVSLYPALGQGVYRLGFPEGLAALLGRADRVLGGEFEATNVGHLFRQVLIEQQLDARLLRHLEEEEHVLPRVAVTGRGLDPGRHKPRLGHVLEDVSLEQHAAEAGVGDLLQPR